VFSSVHIIIDSKVLSVNTSAVVKAGSEKYDISVAEVTTVDVWVSVETVVDSDVDVVVADIVEVVVVVSTADDVVVRMVVAVAVEVEVMVLTVVVCVVCVADVVSDDEESTTEADVTAVVVPVADA